MKMDDGVLCIDKSRSRKSSRQVKESLRSRNSSICSVQERKYMSAADVNNYTVQSTQSRSNFSKMDSVSGQDESVSSSKSFAKNFFNKLSRKKKILRRQATPTI